MPLSFPGYWLFPDFRFNPLPGALGFFSSGLDTLKMGNEDRGESVRDQCGGSPPLLPSCKWEQIQDIPAYPFLGKEIQGKSCLGSAKLRVLGAAPPPVPPALRGGAAAA